MIFSHHSVLTLPNRNCMLSKKCKYSFLFLPKKTRMETRSQGEEILFILATSLNQSGSGTCFSRNSWSVFLEETGGAFHWGAAFLPDSKRCSTVGFERKGNLSIVLYITTTSVHKQTHFNWQSLSLGDGRFITPAKIPMRVFVSPQTFPVRNISCHLRPSSFPLQSVITCVRDHPPKTTGCSTRSAASLLNWGGTASAANYEHGSTIKYWCINWKCERFFPKQMMTQTGQAHDL